MFCKLYRRISSCFLSSLLLLFLLTSVLSHHSKTYAQNSKLTVGNTTDSEGYFIRKDILNQIKQDSLPLAGEMLDFNEKRAVEQHDEVRLIHIYFDKALVFYKENHFNESLSFYNKALTQSRAVKDTGQTIKSLKALSDLYIELSIADSAFMYCERELELNKTLKNYTAVSDNFRRLYSITRYTIGGVSASKFIISGLLDSSLAYAKKSKHPGAVVFAMSNIAGNAYENDPEKEMELNRAAIDSARKIATPSRALVYALLQSYDNLWDAGYYQEAEDNLLEALPMALSFNNPSWIGHIYWLLGRIENSKGNKKKALSNLRKAVYYCDQGTVSPLKRSIYSSIRDLYRELGNIDSTLYFLDKYSRLTQKAHDSAMNKRISLLSAKFKVAEKEGKIELLDELNHQKEERLALQNKFLYSLVLFIGIVLVLLIVLFTQYTRTQKAYRILTHKTDEIQKQQKEIVRLNGEKRAHIKSRLEPKKVKLVELFEEDKVYLDKNLSLKMVASLIDTNTSYLSTLINSVYNCNFAQFVNKYRVLEACERLGDEQNEIYSIEGVGEMSGFISKSAFNKAFKENTGLTPSTFRKNLRTNGN